MKLTISVAFISQGNYTDRVATTCRRSQRKFLQVEGSRVAGDAGIQYR
jgi:hypothetical protein